MRFPLPREGEGAGVCGITIQQVTALAPALSQSERAFFRRHSARWIRASVAREERIGVERLRVATAVNLRVLSRRCH